MEVLIIGGIDYSRKIKRKGLAWSRNDIDSDNTTRTKNGKMRRQKITDKRKLSYTLMNMSRAELAQLDTAVSANTVNVTYLDLHGVMTKEFYCSSFSAVLSDCADGESKWESASLTLTEV